MNNADGYTEQQKDVINSMIIAERNRWERKSNQTKNKFYLKEGIESQSGIISGGRAYCYNRMVQMHFYINSKGLLSTKPITIIVAKSNILSFTIVGNKYQPYDESGDISNFITFKIEDNKLWAIKNSDDVEDTFDCNLVMELEE